MDFPHLLFTYTATGVFEHPDDVTVAPNEWANFSCTVHCSLSPVKWYKAGHPYPIDHPTVASIDGLKFEIPSNSTCTSENKTIHFLDVLATKQIHNSAFYCAAYETCHRCTQTECKCGCDRCYSRPALLRGKPCCAWISLCFPHLHFLYSNLNSANDSYTYTSTHFYCITYFAWCTCMFFDVMCLLLKSI